MESTGVHSTNILIEISCPQPTNHEATLEHEQHYGILLVGVEVPVMSTAAATVTAHSRYAWVRDWSERSGL